MRYLLAAGAVLFVHSFYDQKCCGGIDCHPVPCEELVEVDNGWLYIPTHNFFAREQVMPSQDRQCHVCMSNDGSSQPGRSLCAYIQTGT